MYHVADKYLRDRREGRAPVSDSELLFDLIYVFSVTQLSHYLLHHLGWLGLIQETALWFAVWLAWQHTAWVTNWFDPETRTIRLLLFVLMILGLFMAASIPEAYGSRGTIFASAYVAIQVGRTLCVVILLDRRHTLTPNFRRILGWFVISAFFWIAGAFLDGPARLISWLAGALCDYASPLFGFYLPGLGRSDSGREWTVEGQHLTERSQLFVIIAFGETILMTGASFSELETWTRPAIATTLLSFISSLAMWWIYFDISSEAASLKIKKTSDPGWLGLRYHMIHVVLVGALIVCAVGDDLAVQHPLRSASLGAVFTMIVGPMVYLAANIVYKWLLSRQIAWSHAGAIGLLSLLIWFHSRLTLLWINAGVTAIFVVVVIYETIRYKERDAEAVLN